jgi:hypothetical protein
MILSRDVQNHISALWWAYLISDYKEGQRIRAKYALALLSYGQCP